jgi:hypothetical protein
MSRTKIIRELVDQSGTSEDSYFDICKAIALIFPKQIAEQLEQLVNGPVWDGDVISKADRGVLFDMGLAIRVCHKGQQGYTGANYTAFTILKEIKKLSS